MEENTRERERETQIHTGGGRVVGADWERESKRDSAHERKSEVDLKRDVSSPEGKNVEKERILRWNFEK